MAINATNNHPPKTTNPTAQQATAQGQNAPQQTSEPKAKATSAQHRQTLDQFDAGPQTKPSYWFDKPTEFKNQDEAKQYLDKLTKETRVHCSRDDFEMGTAKYQRCEAAKKKLQQLVHSTQVPLRDGMSPAETAEGCRFISEKAPEYIGMTPEALSQVPAGDKAELLSKLGLPFNREATDNPMFMALNGENMNQAFTSAVDCLRSPGKKAFESTSRGQGKHRVVMGVGEQGQLSSFDTSRVRNRRGLASRIASAASGLRRFLNPIGPLPLPDKISTPPSLPGQPPLSAVLPYVRPPLAFPPKTDLPIPPGNDGPAATLPVVKGIKSGSLT